MNPTPPQETSERTDTAPATTALGAVTLPPDLARPTKRSFSIRGHRTSVSLETPFWQGLVALAAERGMPLARLVAAIDEVRGDAGLSSAIRVFVLEAYRDRPMRGGDARPTDGANGPARTAVTAPASRP